MAKTQQKDKKYNTSNPLKSLWMYWFVLVGFVLKFIGIGFIAYGIWLCIKYGSELNLSEIGIFFATSIIIIVLAGILFSFGLIYQIIKDVSSQISELSETIKETFTKDIDKITNVSPLSSGAISNLELKLNEIRDIMKDINENLLLTEEGKIRKLEVLALQEIHQGLKKVEEYVEARQWHKARDILDMLSIKYPDNTDVKTRLERLKEEQEKAFSEEFTRTKKLINDLIAISAYNKALQHAQALLEKYPNSPAVKELIETVRHEKEKFCNEQIRHMYNEIEKAIERKRWNDALTVAYQLLEKYPDCPESQILREKLETLKTNAEIERRQNLEEQYKDLLKRKHFIQALELARYIITTYPNSPQAKALQEQIPKLEELVEKEEKS